MLIQPWIKVMYCSLLCLTLHIRAGINISHLSIPEIVSNGRCYISQFFSFLPAVLLNCLSCRACILQMGNKPNQFLIQIKICFFSNLWFCPSFKSLLLLLWLLFLSLLIIIITFIIFYMFCFAIISYFHCLVMPRYL